MLRKGVDVHWYFNVAKNLHTGSSWEQGIKSVKHILSAILCSGLAGLPALKCHFPNDFELLTILCEVEAMLNCRPITKFMNDVNDWHALMPLAILTGNLHPHSPVIEFNKGDMYHQNYNYVVAASEQFWSRRLEM